ncbi:MAG: TPM domain-containing protein [Pseudomonadota bacterium]
MHRTVLIFLFAFWGGLAAAQDYPEYTSTYVNDFANVIEDGVEAQLTEDLKKLRSEHDIEMTVVTIERRADYGQSASWEAFATGLFNAWGVGDAKQNNGIMVLVASIDREIRIELGSGWGPEYDDRAKVIIEDVFVPYLRKNDFSSGIEAGSLAVMERFSPGYVPAEGEDGSSDASDWWFIAFGGLVAALLGFHRQIGDASLRVRRCPSCQRRGLSRSRTVQREATKGQDGKEDVLTTCVHCDYRHMTHRTWAYSSGSSGGGSFGGGSSSGGGASGRF